MSSGATTAPDSRERWESSLWNIWKEYQLVLVNESINYFRAEVSTERQNGKYLRLGQSGNTNKSPLHFLCRTQCGSMGPCCSKRSHAHGTKTPCWRANNAVWPWKERILLLEEVISFLFSRYCIQQARCLCSMRPFRAKGPLKRYVCFQMPQDEISQDPWLQILLSLCICWCSK